MITENDFIYCPLCKNKFVKSGKNLLLCSSCGLHYYINPKICNAVILENELGEILLVKRKYNPKNGYWDLPGGFVESGETLEESTYRELKEELGVDKVDLKYVGSMHDDYEYENLLYKTVCAVYSGFIPTSLYLSVSDDVSGFQFFNKEDIPYERVAFEGTKTAIKKYIESRNV